MGEEEIEEIVADADDAVELKDVDAGGGKSGKKEKAAKPQGTKKK